MIDSMRIVCTGDHPARRHDDEVIKRFTVMWLDGEPKVIPLANAGKQAYIFGEGEGAEYVPKTTDPHEVIARRYAGESWHIPLSMRCETCGFSRKRRWDKLEPQLEECARHGVSDVPLTGL